MNAIINYLRNRPLTLLDLLFLFLIIEYIALGKYSFIQIHDFADDIFPRYIALWRNFSESGFQYWSSDIGAGTDRLTNLVYYDNLLSLLISIFPAWLAYQIYIVSTTYAGVIGFYKLSTVYFNYPKEFAALTAVFIPLIVSFTNSTGLSAGIQFYPFAIFSVYWLNSRVESLPLRLIFLIGLIYFTSIIISFTLGFIYLAPFMLLWFAMLGRVKPTTVISIAAGFLVVAGIHHENIIALVTHVRESHRAEFTELATDEGSNYFFYLIIPTLLSVFLIVKNRIINGRLLVIFAVFLLITVGDNVLNYLWDAVFGRTALASLKISRLAFFSTSLFGIIILWIASQVGRKERKLLALVLCINFVVIAIDLKLSNSIQWIKSGNYVANFETQSLKDLRAGDNHSVFRVSVIHGVTHPNMLTAYGFESADGYSPMYPKSYKNYWTQVVSPLLEKDKGYKTYFLDWGSRFYLFTGVPANDGRYEVVKFRDFFNLNLLSLANVKYIISHQPIVDERLEMISAGVNAMSLGSFDKFKLRLKENLSGRRSLFIYKNPDALERIYAVNKIRYFNDDKELFAYANSASIDEIKRSAFVLNKFKKKLSQYDFEHIKASVTITGYSSAKIDFLVRSSGDAMVVLTDSSNLNWKCVSEGRDLEIYNVYGAFFSVVVGPGENSVSCQYRPKWAWLDRSFISAL
jgi:hypothetical protein